MALLLSFTATAQVPEAQLVQTLKTTIGALKLLPGLKSETTKAIDSANNKIKDNSSLDEAIKASKELSKALENDPAAKGPPKIAFDAAVAAVEAANAGTTPKGSILLYGISVLFLVLCY